MPINDDPETPFDNPENPSIDITFENEAMGEVISLFHHLDSGNLSIAVNGEDGYIFGPDEWRTLLNWLQANHGIRNWIDGQKEKKTSAEFHARLKLFEQTGLRGVELAVAALPPEEDM